MNELKMVTGCIVAFSIAGLFIALCSRKMLLVHEPFGLCLRIKILHFCQMMRCLGHEVIHNGVEGSDVPCEHVQIMSLKMQ
jgi:hypothetical protein